MDIRDEIKLSKGDMFPDSNENKHRNKLPGVKAIDRVSPIKSKSKVTGKSNSPKSRWLPMSERVISPQPVTQYNPITGEVRKESEKAAVVKGNSVVSKSKVGKSKVAAVVSEKSTVVKESVVKSIEKSTVVKESDVTSKVGKSNVSAVVSEKSAVDEKDNPKVSKVSDESNKAAVVAPVIEKVSVATESVKAPVAKKSVKAPVVAHYKRKTELSKDKETKPVVVVDVKAPVVAAVESVVEKDNPKVMSKVSDESVKASVVKESVKVPVVKKSVKASSVVADKPSSVVADKVDVVKDNINVVADKVVKENVLSVVADKALNINVVAVADKALDALKNKPAGKGKKPVVGKDKDKPKNIAPDVVKEKFKPNQKQKVISSEILVLRLSKQKENPKFEAKVNVKRKLILSKEDDRKKKLKGNSKKDVSDSKLETDVVDYSSDEADRKQKKLNIKAGLKRLRSGSDSSDSSELDTKTIKRLISKLEKKVKKHESDEEGVPKKGKKILTKKVEKEEYDEESDEGSVPKKGKKKLTKKVKKEESDQESVPKKGKKKEKQLTPKEAAYEEYLSSFPSFHARTTPSSLFSAIRNSRVDILGILTDIGFSSLHNISIDNLPSKLGFCCVQIQILHVEFRFRR
ncbi:peptidase C48, SUMO/sentrin/Ubl1 [Tanacetum coccineum]